MRVDLSSTDFDYLDPAIVVRVLDVAVHVPDELQAPQLPGQGGAAKVASSSRRGPRRFR